MWPRQITFVRHAQSEGNIRDVDERAEYDVATHAYSLTPYGREQAAITGKYLREKYGEFDVYYSSYYKRAKETLQIIAPNAKHYEDSRLAEGQRGVWHTMTRDQVVQRFPEELARKEREGLYHYRPFGGENWADMELRIHSYLGTINRDYPSERVCIIVHGHWLLLCQRLIERFSIEEAERRYKQHIAKNASVTTYLGVERNGKSRLLLDEENVAPWEGVV